MFELCRLEIIALHRFFVDWFSGRADPAAFVRVESALAPEFHLVSPRGVVDDRAAILSSIQRAHGQLDLDIVTRAITERLVADDLCLVTYEEHQRRPGERTARISSAWFRKSPGAPGGVEWVHVHETWLPGD